MKITYIATDSNADNITDVDNGFGIDSVDEELLTVTEVTEYEIALINRLDVISISCIISTCLLFLLLLRFHK